MYLSFNKNFFNFQNNIFLHVTVFPYYSTLVRATKPKNLSTLFFLILTLLTLGYFYFFFFTFGQLNNKTTVNYKVTSILFLVL